jgi:hypothetical protein
MNTNPNNIDYASLSSRRIEATKRIANVLYQLGSQHLFLSEEMALQCDEDFRILVEDCYQHLQKRLSWPPDKPYYAKKIILDKPEMRYWKSILKYLDLYKFIHINFLCNGLSEDSHFCAALNEYENKISYSCLNIPVEKWCQYKILSEYKGDTVENKEIY